MSDWIDVTQPISADMVFWPGQVAPSFERLSNMDSGHMANVTKLSLSMHTGTHMDAPLHFFNDGKDIAQMPPETGVGDLRLIQHRGKGHITADDLRQYESRTRSIKEGERIFFKTHHSQEDWLKQDFKEDYTGVSAGAAEYLREKKVRLVGIDYLSIAPMDDLLNVHHILLGSGIWITEGLKLDGLEEGDYEVICLPLKILGADGSPARVLLRPKQK